MAYVYQNVIVGDTLSSGDSGAILSRDPGYLITGDGTRSVVLPVGSAGEILTVDPLAASGLSWQSIADTIVQAGDGLSFTGNELNVGSSATIGTTADAVHVASSAVAGQVIISTGVAGDPAVYGALDLSNSDSVTGILPPESGGTGTVLTGLTPGSVMIVNSTGDGIVESTINVSDLPSRVEVITTDATPTAISTIATAADTAYTVSANVLARSGADVANFRIRATFNNAGGTLTLVGTDLVYVPLASDFEATIIASGTDIVVQVTGTTATVNWAANVEVLSIGA